MISRCFGAVISFNDRICARDRPYIMVVIIRPYPRAISLQKGIVSVHRAHFAEIDIGGRNCYFARNSCRLYGGMLKGVPLLFYYF